MKEVLLLLLHVIIFPIHPTCFPSIIEHPAGHVTSMFLPLEHVVEQVEPKPPITALRAFLERDFKFFISKYFSGQCFKFK